jgi:hypothetical protein
MVKQYSLSLALSSVAQALVLGLVFIGCSGESLREPALKSAALVGSAKAKAELLKQPTGNVFSLTIEGASIMPEFTQEQITSVCALSFFNELSESQRSGNCFVRVSISQEKEAPMQATFTCEELTIADRCIENAATFLSWHPSRGLDSIRPAIDASFFPDSSLVYIGQSILAQDTADNRWMRTEIMGFRQDTIANIPVLVLNAKSIRKQQTQWYDVFARYSNQKLIFVSAKLGQTK